MRQLFQACRLCFKLIGNRFSAGFSPKLMQEAPQIVTVIPMVAAGFGVSIVPRSFSNVDFAGVNYVDIEEDAPRSAIGLAYRRDERSLAIKNAIKAARLAKLTRE